jgi:glycine oxidase
MPSSTDLLIIGGGVIGLSIARQAAREGLSVRLLEKDEPGGAASSAAAGMLSPQVDAEGPGPLLSIGLRSRDLFPALVAALEEESGIDAGLNDAGALRVARGPEGRGRLERQAAFQSAAGLPVERLEGRSLRALEPLLDPAIDAGLLFPRDGCVDNVALVRALRVAAERAGARIESGAAVERLRLSRGAVAGAETATARFAAGAVVVAAGAWSGGIAGRGVARLPAHPVKGQIVCLGPAARPMARVVAGDGCYLVPRPDGRILVGSTMERAGFDTTVTAGAVADLTAAALRLAPGLRPARFHSAWAGLRPATGDDLPAIGPGPAPGLWYACGHLRNGILLAPITARLIVRMIRGQAVDNDPKAFDPRRFAAAGGRGRAVRRTLRRAPRAADATRR